MSICHLVAYLTTESSHRRAWQELQESGLPPPQEDLAKWEAQYNQMMAEGREDLDFDYGSVVEEAYNESAANDTSMKFDDQGIPVLGEYTFGTVISGRLGRSFLTVHHHQRRTTDILTNRRRQVPISATPKPCSNKAVL